MPVLDCSEVVAPERMHEQLLANCVAGNIHSAVVSGDQRLSKVEKINRRLLSMANPQQCAAVERVMQLWNGLRDMFIYFGLSPRALGTLRTAMFENLNDKLFRSTMNPVAQVLRDAKMSKSDVTDIVLVGGSSRIPRVQLNFFRTSSMGSSHAVGLIPMRPLFTVLLSRQRSSRAIHRRL